MACAKGWNRILETDSDSTDFVAVQKHRKEWYYGTVHFLGQWSREIKCPVYVNEIFIQNSRQIWWIKQQNVWVYLKRLDLWHKNNTNFNSIFCLIKSSKLILFFYLHFTWISGSWHHQRILKKWPFWKNDSWFSSKESKLTSVKYPWNYAFSCMENYIFIIIAPLVVIVLTKCDL